MRNQLNRGLPRRLMYVEAKEGLVEGARARIGWATFSRTGATVYYRGHVLQKGEGVSGNFFEEETGREFWVSGVKQHGSNAHPAERGFHIEIDADALDEYELLRASNKRLSNKNKG